MVITTKFDVGQKVWRLKDNKAVESEIQLIEVTVYGTDPIIQYWVDRVNVDGNCCKEKDLFESREKLIEGL
jgi:hypothetical protein